jgi:flagellar basal body-associated protein FliL
MEEKTSPEKNRELNNAPKKKKNVILIVLIIVLAVLAIVLGVLLKLETGKTGDLRNELNKSNSEKLEITNELNELYLEYEELKTNNDSINAQLELDQERIQELLDELKRVKYSNSVKIAEFKDQVTSLKKSHTRLQSTIDSLNVVNRQLTRENLLVKDENLRYQGEIEEMTEKQEVLEKKVQLASTLDALNIDVTGYKENGNETRRYNKVKKLETCFNLSENNVAEPGTRTIYIRIARPDDYILISDTANLFEYEGKKIAYTSKKEAEYEGKEKRVCIDYQVKEPQIEGKYIVEIFCEGQKIGTAVHFMKKWTLF